MNKLDREKCFIAGGRVKVTHDNIIEFKGTKKGILVNIKPQNDFEIIKNQLIEKLEKTQSFFKGAKISHIQCETLTEEEKGELATIMTKKYQMHINDKQEITNKEKKEAVFEGIIEGKTRFIKGTLRSGQIVNYDGNVVILGDVNPGAQVIAHGNIIIMGSLRGMAHAGANGNISACVAAYILDPSQLRIADIIARSPDGEYDKPQKPELATIQNNMVYIEPYSTKNIYY